jgi:hypothetical protein
VGSQDFFNFIHRQIVTDDGHQIIDNYQQKKNFDGIEDKKIQATGQMTG